MMTEGMAAMRSTTLVMILASFFGAMNTMKIDRSSEAGTEIASAMTDSRIEP